MSALILFVTVVTSVGIGVIAAYAVVNGILFAMASRPERQPVAVLVASQTTASGD